VDDVLASVFAALAWTGNLVLWLLLRAQGQSASFLLKQYVSLKLVAWTVLILCETMYHVHLVFPAVAAALPWMPIEAYDTIRKTSFRLLMAVATWMLIRNLLSPRIVSTKPVPEAQIQMDRNGIVVEWNEAATALFGWTSGEMIGQELAAYIIPEHFREAHRRGLQRFRETGEAPLLNTRYTQTALRKEPLPPLVVDVRVTARLTANGTIFEGALSPAKG
jgi:PAS domain-containing protein